MQVDNNFLLKNRLVVLKLARDFWITEPGDKLNTIDYYVNEFNVSRGTIQAAMQFLIEKNCIETSFRGQLGTFLLRKNAAKLWEQTGYGSLLGCMPLPIQLLAAGLSTGICANMKEKNISFNCVFVQGANLRFEGLNRKRFDFVVASRLTEKVLSEDYALVKYSNIRVAMDLPGPLYTGKYVILFADQTKSEVEDGMSVAVDPNSLDQMYLTKKLCEGKKRIVYKNVTYIGTRASVLKGKADFTITRTDNIGNLISRCVSLPEDIIEDSQRLHEPVIFYHKDNYGIEKLLKKVLNPIDIKLKQQMVIDEKMLPDYY